MPATLLVFKYPPSQLAFAPLRHLMHLTVFEASRGDFSSNLQCIFPESSSPSTNKGVRWQIQTARVPRMLWPESAYLRQCNELDELNRFSRQEEV
jgi:hypothetical protein